jgi:hypothetical protein
MLVEPLSVDIYKMAMEAGVSEIHLEFSGGSDEGCLIISCVKADLAEAWTDLDEKIEEWAWQVYEYSGAGDGNEYGDNIVYNLVEGTVTTQEWFHERSYGELEELPLVREEEEEEEEEPADASARAKLIEDAVESKTNEKNPEWTGQAPTP